MRFGSATKGICHHSDVVAILYIIWAFTGCPVHNMNQNLEDMVGSKRGLNFKSEGEQRIAHFLDDNSIKYHYEPGVLVNSYEKKPRIWYPDFYLPEFGTYLEYFGLVGQEDYDRGVKRKKSTYSKMGLDVIPLYPWTFAEDWQGYIMKELKRTAVHRYRRLLAKPYWSQNRSVSANHVNRSSQGYRKQSFKRY